MQCQFCSSWECVAYSVLLHKCGAYPWSRLDKLKQPLLFMSQSIDSSVATSAWDVYQHTREPTQDTATAVNSRVTETFLQTTSRIRVRSYVNDVPGHYH